MKQSKFEKVQSILNSIYNKLIRLMDIDRFYAALYDYRKNELEFPFVMDDGQQVIWPSRPYQPHLLPDLGRKKKETLLFENNFPIEIESEGINYWPDGKLPCSWICTPMISSKKVIGVLVAENMRSPRAFGDDSVRILSTISIHAAISIDNELLNFRLNHKITLMEAVHRLGKELTSGIQLEESEILDMIHQRASGFMDTENMYIALYHPDPAQPDELDKGVLYGKINFDLMFIDNKRQKKWSRKPKVGEYGRTEEIILSHESILISTLDESESWYKESGRKEFIGNPFASWIGVPIEKEKKVLGVIATYHTTKDYVYSEDELDVLQAMANTAAIALENSRLYRKLEESKKSLESAIVKIAERENILTRSVIAADIVHRLNNLGGTIPVWANTIKEKTGQMTNEILGNMKQLAHISEQAMNHKTMAEDESDFIYRLHNIISTIPIRISQLKTVIDDKTNKIHDDVEDLRSEVDHLNEPPQLVKTNIITILKTISDQLRIQYHERIKKGGMEIDDRDISPDLHKVMAFPKTLPNAIFNIISNSAESLTEKASGVLSVKAENYKDDNDSDWVRIEISDTGTGIPKEIFNKLFTPFVSTKGEKRGYGLWRTKNVIENIGGQIWFDSEKDEGAMCIILLPALQED